MGVRESALSWLPLEMKGLPVPLTGVTESRTHRAQLSNGIRGVGGESIQDHNGRFVMGVLQKFIENELLVIALFSLRCPWTLPAPQ